MRIGVPSIEAVLLVVNVALALVIGGVYLTPDSSAGGAAAHDVSVPLREGGPPVLVVVAGTIATDSAVGRPVAEALGGVLLVVPATGITERTIADLSRSRSDRVLILGGPAAVPEATATALGRYTSGSVTRLFGVDRFDTAAKVATAHFSSPVPQVRILSGLAAAPVLAPDQERSATPVLLVEQDRIPAGAARALLRLRPQSIQVVGGPSFVSEAVLQQLRTYATGQVVRTDAKASDQA